jgi:hypothetical protein
MWDMLMVALRVALTVALYAYISECARYSIDNLFVEMYGYAHAGVDRLATIAFNTVRWYFMKSVDVNVEKINSFHYGEFCSDNMTEADDIRSYMRYFYASDRDATLAGIILDRFLGSALSVLNVCTIVVIVFLLRMQRQLEQRFHSEADVSNDEHVNYLQLSRTLARMERAYEEKERRLEERIEELMRLCVSQEARNDYEGDHEMANLENLRRDAIANHAESMRGVRDVVAQEMARGMDELRKGIAAECMRAIRGRIPEVTMTTSCGNTGCKMSDESYEKYTTWMGNMGNGLRKASSRQKIHLWYASYLAEELRAYEIMDQLDNAYLDLEERMEAARFDHAGNDALHQDTSMERDGWPTNGPQTGGRFNPWGQVPVFSDNCGDMRQMAQDARDSSNNENYNRQSADYYKTADISEGFDKAFDRSLRDTTRTLLGARNTMREAQSFRQNREMLQKKAEAKGPEDSERTKRLQGKAQNAFKYILLHFAPIEGGYIYCDTLRESFDRYMNYKGEIHDPEKFILWLSTRLTFLQKAVFVDLGWQMIAIEEAYIEFALQEKEGTADKQAIATLKKVKLEVPVFTTKPPKQKKEKGKLCDPTTIEMSPKVTSSTDTGPELVAPVVEASSSSSVLCNTVPSKASDNNSCVKEFGETPPPSRQSRFNAPVVEAKKPLTPCPQFLLPERVNLDEKNRTITEGDVGKFAFFQTGGRECQCEIRPMHVGKFTLHIRNRWADEEFPCQCKDCVLQAQKVVVEAVKRHAAENDTMVPCDNKTVVVVGVDTPFPKEHLFYDEKQVSVQSEKNFVDDLKQRYKKAFRSKNAPIALGTAGVKGWQQNMKLMVKEHLLEYGVKEFRVGENDYLINRIVFSEQFRRTYYMSKDAGRTAYEAIMYLVNPELEVEDAAKLLAKGVEISRRDTFPFEQNVRDPESRVQAGASIPMQPLHRVKLQIGNEIYESNFVALQRNKIPVKGTTFTIFATAVSGHYEQISMFEGQTTAEMSFVGELSQAEKKAQGKVAIHIRDEMLMFAVVDVDFPVMTVQRFSSDDLEIGTPCVYVWHDGKELKTSNTGYIVKNETGLIHTTANIHNIGTDDGTGCCGGILLASRNNRSYMPLGMHCMYDSESKVNIAQLLPPGTIKVPPFVTAGF